MYVCLYVCDSMKASGWYVGFLFFLNTGINLIQAAKACMLSCQSHYIYHFLKYVWG